MAVVQAAPEELAERLGLKLASELLPDRAVRTPGMVVPAPVHPVTADLVPLLPAGGLSGQVALPRRPGASSLLWRLLAGPTSAGSWCAVVGPGDLYPLAATAAGVDLNRVALVDARGPDQVLAVLGALCEGVPVVAVSSAGLTVRQVQRAASRARRSGTVLVWREGPVQVPGVEARLEAVACRWRGLRENAGRRWGAGRLNSCWISVSAGWRGDARPHRGEVWPYGDGSDDYGEAP